VFSFPTGRPRRSKGARAFFFFDTFCILAITRDSSYDHLDEDYSLNSFVSISYIGNVDSSLATRKGNPAFMTMPPTKILLHINRMPNNTPSERREPLLSKTQWVTSAAALLGLSAASWYLQHLQCTKCIENGELIEECMLFQQEPVLSFLLILTHLIPFALLPFTMYVIWKQTPFLLQHTDKEMHPFSLLLGLTFIGFGCAFEFGYHVSQAWYYRNSFDVQNYIFYFFLISSFALWADGFYSSKVVDVVFAAAVLLASVMYPVGAMKQASAFKGSIYCALTVSFYFVTVRGKTMLQDVRMLWVPFFAVGVNMFFVALLQNADKDGQLTRWNYIYHICHDVLGTEMGTAVFTYLIHDNPRHRRVAKAEVMEKAV